VTGVRLGAVLLALVASAAPAQAIRLDPPPPTDYAPVWSPDATAIAFVRWTGRPDQPPRLWVMRPDGSGARQLPAPTGTFSPDWRWVLYSTWLGTPTNTLRLYVVRPEGEDQRALASATGIGGTTAAWSPDGSQIAFGTQVHEGEQQSLVVQDVDTGALRVVTPNADHPVWSPDGRKLAFENVAPALSGEPDLGVVNVDGTGRRLLRAPDVVDWGYPDRGTTLVAWSPDSRTLAIPRDRGEPNLWLVDVDGPRRRRVPLVEPIGDRLEWVSRTTIIASSQGIYRIDPRTGLTFRLARFGGSLDVSYDGQQLVFGGAPFCATGIYRLAATGGRPVRLSPDCRIVGTAGRDVLTGTQHPDILVGGGGDDELRAFDDFYYEGDVLEGGAGNDNIIGSGGTDVLRGGPGRDTFDGGGAPDTIDAVDGTRDAVACGTHPGSDVERDVANVDRFDVVSRDCEYVYYPGRYVRPPDTSLLIRAWRGARPARVANRIVDPARTWRLSCAPPRGSFPRAATVCDRIARAGNVFAPIPADAVCPRRSARLGYVRVNGTFRGRLVTAIVRRRDGCELAQWRLLGIPDVF
jgi:dipeptidyl aminopeptidase/acylaminoacyl peptidase